MMRMSGDLRSKSCAWLCALLVVCGGSVPTASAQGGSRPVVISFGQPNIWSLEQAHYLLARMHRQNLDLKATDLTADALNPNAVNATRINILKSLLEIGVEYDQAVGLQNKRLIRDSRYDSRRRSDLTTKRDSLRPVALELTRDVARLKSERASMEVAGESADAIKLKDAEIAGKEAERAAVERELTFYDDELKTLSPESTSTPQAPADPADPFDPAGLPQSVLDKLIEKNADKLLEAAKDPKLNASTILDNHVQMQYEIVAKQLTLLRDEVGPGERLIFLELPQSIYTTPGDGDNKMAQVWWHVNGYTRTDESSRLLVELSRIYESWRMVKNLAPFKALIDNEGITLHETVEDACRPHAERSATTSQKSPRGKLDGNLVEGFDGLQCEFRSAERRVIELLLRQANNLFARAEQRGVQNTNRLTDAVRDVVQVETRDGKRGGVSALDKSARGGNDAELDASKSRNDLLDKLSKIYSQQDESAAGLSSTLRDITEFVRLDAPPIKSETSASERVPIRDVRTVDIIPRQSSLNVNDVQATIKATGIAAAFKFLFGFAGKVNYQRQREQYEQYLHQELYAAGFGKGEKDFGWTFGALPGTKRVAPGVRTTYAVMVVPQEAESIVLSARGCYFPRKGDQPPDYAGTGHADWSEKSKPERRQCGAEQTFILPVPGGGNNTNQFWVTGIDYNPAEPGEIVTASITGNNFSPQIGVLINGVPLEQSVGLAQPLLRIERDAAAPRCDEDYKGICGSLERVDPEQIVLSFRMPTAGTPAITLVAPGRSRDLNTLRLNINGTRNVRLGDADFMFGKRPTIAASRLTIADLQTFRINPNSAQVIGLLKGTNFDERDEVLVNGRPPARVEFKSSELYRLTFDLPASEDLNITIVQTATEAAKKAVATRSFPNSSKLNVGDLRVISYEPPDRTTGGVLMVRVLGRGLAAGLRLNARGASERSELFEVSDGEALLKLVDPEASVVVTLTNPSTGERHHAIVVRDTKRTMPIGAATLNATIRE